MFLLDCATKHSNILSNYTIFIPWSWHEQVNLKKWSLKYFVIELLPNKYLRKKRFKRPPSNSILLLPAQWRLLFYLKKSISWHRFWKIINFFIKSSTSTAVIICGAQRIYQYKILYFINSHNRTLCCWE